MTFSRFGKKLTIVLACICISTQSFAIINPDNPPESMRVTVDKSGETRTFFLEKQSLRGVDFGLFLMDADDDSIMIEIDAGPVRTYRGWCEEEPDSYVDATLLPNGDLRYHVFKGAADDWWYDPAGEADAVEGDFYSSNIYGIAEALNGGEVSYSKFNSPEWLGIISDGILSGTPPRDGDATGTNNFTIEAADSEGNTSQAQLNIIVLNMFTGEMGLSDFAGLAHKWLASDCTDTPLCGGADMDDNGNVDSDDLVIFGQKWLW